MREAVGVPSAWSQSLNPPPRDHADGATLSRLRTGGGSEGRRRRTSIEPGVLPRDPDM